MTIGEGAAATRRSGMPGVIAGVLLVYMLLLGGSEAGVFLAPFQVINAVLGAVVVALWIWMLGRGADVVDGLVIAGLALFAMACALSTYPRQSFDAATAALASLPRTHATYEPPRGQC